MGYVASTKPRNAANTVDGLVSRVLALPPSLLWHFFDRLVGRSQIAAAGWRVRERRLSTERFPQRNDEIERLHRRGLTPGQIAQDLGMSRDAVKQVLRRRRKRWVRETGVPTHTRIR